MANGFIASDEYGELPPLKCGWPTSYFKFPYPRNADEKPINILRGAWTIVQAARNEKAVLLAGQEAVEFLATVMLATWPRKRQPVIVMFGDMWGGKPGLSTWFRRQVLRFADRAIDAYVVQSTDELTAFPQVWKVGQGKMYVSLFGYTFHDEDIKDEEITTGDYIFAGGNTQRDYEPVLEAARQLPHQKFIVATWRLNGRTDIPPNVEAGAVPKERFRELMQGAKAVIVPIKGGIMRASGQQTYLNAMRLGKVAIVNEKGILGVRDHIEHEKTGLLVEGTAESYVKAIEWVLDPQNAAKAEQMGKDASAIVKERFTYQNYLSGLVEVVDKMIATTDKPRVRQS